MVEAGCAECWVLGAKCRILTTSVLQDPGVQKATGKTDKVEVMGALRQMKNNS